MRNKPSLKTLESAFPGKGKILRKLLTNDQTVRDHPAAIARDRECYHRPPLHDLRLYALNAETASFGIEHAHHASADEMRCDRRCFDYLNSGDTYNTTIVRFVDGRYRVTTCGDIVERGDYV